MEEKRINFIGDNNDNNNDNDEDIKLQVLSFLPHERIIITILLSCCLLLLLLLLLLLHCFPGKMKSLYPLMGVFWFDPRPVCA